VTIIPIASPVKAKTLNYTKEQEALMKLRYNAKPNSDTVKELVDLLGKDKRSVIAKLSHMQIYVTPPRTTKSGAPIIKKDALVEAIETHMGNKYPSLVKTNKRDLETLLKDMNEHFGA